MSGGVAAETALIDAPLVEDAETGSLLVEGLEADHPLAAEEHPLLVYDWLLWLVASGGVLLLAAILEFQPPRTIIVPVLDLQLPETCSAQQMFGIACPGCGLTRSFVLAAHGELGRAFALHPIGTLLFLLLGLQIPWRLWQGWQASRGRPVWRSGYIEWRIGVLLVLASFLWWAAKGAGLVPALAG